MLDPIEEAKFDELKGKFRDLKIPTPPEIMIGLQVHDKDGNLTFDDIQRGHSWTRNYWNILTLCIFNQTNTSTSVFGPGQLNKKTVDNNFYGYDDYGELIYEAESGVYTKGLVVGTDNTVFDTNQYSLGSQILHGTGIGQLTYSAGSQINSIYNTVDNIWTSTHSRLFNNVNENSIIVRETGIRNTRTFLIERNVLNSEIELVTGSRLTVSYNFSSDFSAIDA